MPNAKEICELIPDYWLFEEECKWGLMEQPGHGHKYTFFMFPDKPWPDPDPEIEHEDDEICALSDKWLEVVDKWAEMIKMSPIEGYYFVESCKTAGWTEKKWRIMHWIYDFAGKKLAELEKHASVSITINCETGS